MIYKLIIICVIILVLIYYLSVILQSLFPKTFKIIEKKEIKLRAIIPFYYWLCKKD